MRKIILDCDTGSDDAAAILLSSSSERLNLLGVTAVMGNLPLEFTYQNARELIGYLGTDTPVLKGEGNPLIRKLWVGSEENHPLPIPQEPRVLSTPRHVDAVEWLRQTLEESDEKVTLVPLAPMTNLAKLFLFYPDLVEEKVEEIVCMGGGYMFGNSTPAAELNIYADPEAAQVVFSFGKPIVMCGLDVCHRAYITEEEADKYFSDIDNKAGKVFYGICKQSYEWMKRDDIPEQYRLWDKKGAIVYDTVPIVYLLNPDIFETIAANINVECSSDTCDGMTVCETSSWHDSTPKIHKVVLDLDRIAYLETMRDALLQFQG